MDHSGYVDRSDLEKSTTFERGSGYSFFPSDDIAGEDADSPQQQQLQHQRQIKARLDGKYRRSVDDPSPRKDTTGRSIGIHWRKLGKKATTSESDVRPEPDLMPRFDLTAEEETLELCDSSEALALPHDGSPQNEGGSDNQVEMTIEASSSALVAHAAYGVEILPFNDCVSAKVKELSGVKRKNALQPLHTDRNIWPIQEKISSDYDDPEIMEHGQEDEDVDPVLVETQERKRGFQLPKLRIQKRTSPRRAPDLPIASSKAQTDESADDVAATLLDQDNRVRSNTVLRQRKPFSMVAAKSPSVAQQDSPSGDDKDHEARKGMHLRISRGRKPTNNADAARTITPTTKREKVSETIRRKLKMGPQDWKDVSGSGDFEGVWSWDESDSDDSDRDDIGDKSRADSEFDGSRTFQYDESILHAEDILNTDACGAFPSPVMDGVHLKSRRSKEKKELRVKPYDCFASHKVFMTEEEIYRSMLRPSQVVEDLDSFVKPWCHISEKGVTEFEKSYWGTPHDGRIGSVRVEVLGCVGVSKYKSDVSVYLVCGDAAFATDIIQGCRSPMWPHLSKRAACFPIMHAYARLYVGVFDVTKRKKSENDSFCGRVEIGMASLRPDTEYDVTLPLRASTFIYDRRPRGVVRLRISLHWFSERAAILSYLNAPRNAIATHQLFESPSIPCADPKTFRNVAFTIHGQELPGKYTNKALQATMREFNLYQQNFRFLAKQLLHDAMFYVNPLMSMYIFGSWMHCVWSSSVRLAPVYFVGFLILLLLDGYVRNCADGTRNSGYTSVSLPEILRAIVSTGQGRHMHHLSTEKRPIRGADDPSLVMEPYDHLEFPFSEGNEYKKRTIEETLVKGGTGNRRDKQKELLLQERLSICQKQESSLNDSLEVDAFQRAGGDAVQDNEIEGGEQGALDFDSDQDIEIHGDDDNVYGLYALDEEEEQLRPRLGSLSLTSVGSSARSLVVKGPPQDADVRPKTRVPPQVHLARFEDKLHKVTQSLSMDKVFACTLAYRPRSPTNEEFRSVIDIRHDEDGKKRTKRIPLDAFDKRLGYRNRHSNPVTEIKSSFLGPLMRIFRILCCMVRVVFNVGVWNDPYMSFWVLCFLILTVVVLIMFPWRLFFLAVGIACFGPQNILFRKRLELKTASQNTALTADVSVGETEGEDGVNGDDRSKKGNRRGIHNPIALFKERRQKKLAEKQDLHKSASSQTLSALEHHTTGPSLDIRRPFAASGVKATKNLQPREIVVPYSRFRKERFYDWPPDATVARATPVRFEDCRVGMSYGSPISEKDMEDYSNLRRATKTAKSDD